MATMRFRAGQHLRRQGDIRAVREQGRRVDCRAFTLWWKRRTLAPATAADSSAARAPDLPSALPPPEAATPRVCVIASTAAVGAATHRNRAKRRLREVFRHQQHAVPADCDLLLIARAAATNWPMAELEKRFTEACRQMAPSTATGKTP